MLLDEPTAFLDIRHRVAFYEIGTQLKETCGIAALVASHDLSLCAEYGERIVLLSGGTVAAQGRPEEVLTPENVRIVESDGRRRTYRWINDVDFGGRTANVFECLEETSEETKHFVWLTGFRVDATNIEELSERGGRQRWKIENEGFNTQKNGGYGLEHAFSENNVALKNFYLLMQIGHIFNQLMEKGSLLRERIRATMGSLKVFSQRLWAVLTETVIDEARLRAVLGTRIQIRFESG